MKYLQANEMFNPPPKQMVSFLSKLVKWYFKTHIEGLENLSNEKPALYVSNHTLLGLTDGPLYIPALYKKKDIFLRPLADSMHLEIPLWRSIMTDYGVVEASRKNVASLMQQQQHILVFPGGTNEVCKVKGEEYQLKWQERYGFVKMAIENEYPIIPISGLGGDEIYDIVWDKNDIMNSKFGALLNKTGIADKYLKGGKIIPPIVKGVKGTLLPKSVALYYKFGKAINTKAYKKDASTKNLKQLRQEVEQAIYQGIREMKVLRDRM